jgi:hypothetical protein
MEREYYKKQTYNVVEIKMNTSKNESYELQNELINSAKEYQLYLENFQDLDDEVTIDGFPLMSFDEFLTH